MNTRKTLLTLIALTVATGLTSAVLAQTFGFTNFNTSYVNTWMQVQLNSAAVREAQRRLDRVTGQTTQAKQASTRTQAQNAPQSVFRPGAQRLLVRQFAQSLSNKPDEVQGLVTMFNEGFKAFEAEATRLKRANNVAMAFTYLIGVCYMVHSDEEPSETALLNLQAGWDTVFGESPNFKKLSNQDRQKLYETFVLMATLPLAGYTYSVQQNDQELLKTYREIAAVALETALGVRPDRLKFTATGLEQR